MKKQPNRLLCVLIQEMEGVPQVQSFVDNCEGCERAVWRAESSSKYAIAICRHCIRQRQRAGAKIMHVQPNKRQLADIRKALGKENE